MLSRELENFCIVEETGTWFMPIPVKNKKTESHDIRTGCRALSRRHQDRVIGLPPRPGNSRQVRVMQCCQQRRPHALKRIRQLLYRRRDRDMVHAYPGREQEDRVTRHQNRMPCALKKRSRQGRRVASTPWHLETTQSHAVLPVKETACSQEKLRAEGDGFNVWGKLPQNIPRSIKETAPTVRSEPLRVRQEVGVEP